MVDESVEAGSRVKGTRNVVNSIRTILGSIAISCSPGYGARLWTTPSRGGSLAPPFCPSSGPL